MLYTRKNSFELIKRLNEPRKFIQIITGPRQTGKTTMVTIVLDKLETPHLYATCDDPEIHDRIWLEQVWERARRKSADCDNFILVLDEVQKVTNWSETVKMLWDDDTKHDRKIKLVLLGSSTLLIQKGLTESLQGRFEIVRSTHWTFEEMHTAFGWDIDTFIQFGGYPGAASLVSEPERWRHYVVDSLIEPTISKDILQMQRIHKPALLRNLFTLGCTYSGQIVSYQKLLGQLQNVGNTTTLAHYLHLLEHAGLLKGMQKYSPSPIRKRGSSPKFIALNTALVTVQSIVTGEIKDRRPDIWGRLVESAAGAHLCNHLQSEPVEVTYWREGNYEVDFVLSVNDAILCVEIKSGARRSFLPGIGAFEKKFGKVHKLLVGGEGMPLKDFFLMNPFTLFGTLTQ